MLLTASEDAVFSYKIVRFEELIVRAYLLVACYNSLNIKEETVYLVSHY